MKQVLYIYEIYLYFIGIQNVFEFLNGVVYMYIFFICDTVPEIGAMRY
jgi:hypothetical protein